jgi:hypothetical protein
MFCANDYLELEKGDLIRDERDLTAREFTHFN